jgi:hypothetical protein
LLGATAVSFETIETVGFMRVSALSTVASELFRFRAVLLLAEDELSDGDQPHPFVPPVPGT